MDKIAPAIKKYTGGDIDEATLRAEGKAGNALAKLLLDAVERLNRAEDEMWAAHRKIQQDLDQIKANLEAGPEDRVYAVEGPAFMNVNPIRMESAISLRGAAIREVQLLTHHYCANRNV